MSAPPLTPGPSLARWRYFIEAARMSVELAHVAKSIAAKRGWLRQASSEIEEADRARFPR